VEDVRRVWAQAHLAVLPSYREGLPKSLLEAAACGRALIASDVPGCREIVQPQITGWLVPPRNSTALAEALQQLLDNAEQRRVFAVAARQRAEKEFAQELVIASTLALYREVVESRQQS